MDVSHDLDTAVGQMLTDRFLQDNTLFPNREALFSAAGIPLDSDDETLATYLGSEQFQTFLSRHTRFRSFEAMMAMANEAWVSRSLFGQEVAMEAVQERTEPQ